MRLEIVGTLLFLLVSVVERAGSVSVPLNIGPTTKYSYSGISIFPTASYYPSGPSTVNLLLYSIPFPRAMNDSSYKATISVQEIYAYLNNKQFSLYFGLDVKHQGDLSIEVNSNMMNKISSLTIRYLVVASVWATFTGWWRQQSVTPYETISSSSPYSYSISTVDYIPPGDTVRVFSVLTGFQVTATAATNELSLILDVTRTGTTTATVTISTLSSTDLHLKLITFSQWSLNQNVILAIPGRITFGTFSASNNGPLCYLDSTNVARHYNSIFGLKGFYINNEAFLSWNLTVTPSVSISATSANSFLYFEFIYLILEQHWCDEPTPYLFMPNETCYDLCPERLYDKYVSMTCEMCLYDCYLCQDATNCTGCNQTLDYRRMNNATGRCLPIDGYYDDGMNHSEALPCVQPCATCQSDVICLSCGPGDYLSSGDCLNCSSNCLNCTSVSNCLECALPYSLSGGFCILVCPDFILNCSTCEVIANTTEVLCLTCDLGYSFVSQSTSCEIICGDAILASTQSCDDGNLNNGDGCSSSCTIQQSFFCGGSIGNTSVCLPCGQHCLNCTNGSSCLLCQQLYEVEGTTGACVANCSEVMYCLACGVGWSDQGQRVICQVCSSGYGVDSHGDCQPICGDGRLAPEEDCEDGNLANGDGCDASCKVESYFNCTPSPTVNISECFLTELTLQFESLLKDPQRNSGWMYFNPHPQNLPIFSILNWSSLLSITNPGMKITAVRYDPQSGRVIADFDYGASLGGQDIKVNINTGNQAKLSKIQVFSVQKISLTDNNQAMVYYSEEQYLVADVVKYMAVLACSISILFMVLGLIGGRLIGLECMATIQLSFLSLLTLTEVSPSFASLSSLGLSFGYNRLKGYDLSQDIDRPFKFVSIDGHWVYNYNFMGLLLLFSLLVALICWFISKRAQKPSMPRWQKISLYAAGEYALYFFLCFSYLAYTSLFVQVKYLAQSMLDYAGLGLGILMVILGIVYLAVYVSAENCFLQFRDKFRSGSRFYVWVMAERILSAAVLVVLQSKQYGNVPIIVIFLVLGAVVLKSRPYRGKNMNIRPFANYLIVILVELIYLSSAFMKDPSGVLAIYGPLLVAVLLLICVVYSAYAIVKDLKECYDAYQLQKVKPSGANQSDMGEFASKLLKQTNCSIFRKSSAIYEGSAKGDESPSKMMVGNLRQRLSSLKMSQKEERENGLMDRQPMEGKMDYPLDDIDDIEGFL